MKLLDFFKNKHRAAMHRQMERTLQGMYQLRERDGEIWLTYEGWYVCPCSMLTMEPVEAILALRDLHRKHVEKSWTT